MSGIAILFNKVTTIISEAGMGHCMTKNCNNLKLYNSTHCWKHLDHNQRQHYVATILDMTEQNEKIINANLQYVEMTGIKFPEHSIFRKCNFSNAKIEECIFSRGDFRGSIFTNASIKGCHFEYADFRGTNTKLNYVDARETHFNGALLQNVDFTGTDLRDAILIDADMIGSMLLNVHLYAARLLNTRLRMECLCNFESLPPRKIKVADEASRDGEKCFTPLLAREVYRQLKNNFRSLSAASDEKWASGKERDMDRARLFRLFFLGERGSDEIALERWDEADREKLFESRFRACFKWAKGLVLKIFGYGENPLVFLCLSLLIIISFSFGFLFYGFEYTTSSGTVVIRSEFSYAQLNTVTFVNDLLTSAYMSVVTFTTLGYGDTQPIGVSRILSGIEALLGFFVYSGFITTFVQRLSKE